MPHTTGPSPIDVEAMFPELVPLRRRTVRLHPRRGAPQVGDSSMGGPLLWPAGEAWPVCEGGPDDHQWYGDPGPVVALVPVLQLYAAQFPDLSFPGGTDVLQMLWCPYDHGPEAVVRPVLCWRRRSDVGALADDVPYPPSPDPDGFVPRPCVLDPEEVVEYPGWDLPVSLAAELHPRFDDLYERTGWVFHHGSAVAQGTKVGGYPGWTQEPDWPVCACGIRMEHLLTVASWEHGGGSEMRWMPLEDRAAGIAEIGNTLDERVMAVQAAAGLMLGDVGGVYLFTCLSCPDRPYAHRFDCS